jgi:hypothetical protein
LAVGLVSLVAVPAVLLSACGNADHKISQDNRPDPRASTQGARSALPTPLPSDPSLDAPNDGIPPEDQVSQAGFGKRDDK